MEISPGIAIAGLCLFLEKDSTLIASDIHIGYEEALNRQGMLLPRFQYKDIMKRFEDAIKSTNPKRIILNGDIKHAFGEIARTEWSQIQKLVEYLGKGREVIIIKGNHDVILDPVAVKIGIGIRDLFITDDTYICHGDIIPETKEFKAAKRIIIGHEHPAVGIREKNRVEKFKCFLKGKFKDKELIVMPSFNTVVEGTDILKEKLLSP